jgi:hypothetical protein
MPGKVRDRVHALARNANANRGLVFTNSQGNNLDTLYPDEDSDADSDYDPAQDDGASYASSEDSNYTPSDDDSNDNDDNNNQPDLAEPQPVELAGVDATTSPIIAGTGNPAGTPGVDAPGNTTGVETPGVQAPAAETPGVDLEAYVNSLEAELDKEIAKLDSK